MNDPAVAPETPANLPPAPAHIPTPAGPVSLLLGPHGLRAGWRLLVYAALVFVVGSILWVPLRQWPAYGAARLWKIMAEELVQLLAFSIPAMLMARLEGRRFGAYGLPVNGLLGKWFWLGVAWGIAALSVMLAVLRWLHVFYFGSVALHGVRIFKFAAFWGLFFLLVGFAEEFAFRGYTLFTLTDGLGFMRNMRWGTSSRREPNGVSYWSAALILSAAFGSVHISNGGENWVGVLAVFSIGMFWCLTLRRTGSLWFGVGFHAAFDWGETYLYSVPDSGTVLPGHLLNSSFHGPVWLTGGSVGPEGSALVFVLLAALAVVFHCVYPDVRYRVATAQTTES